MEEFSSRVTSSATNEVQLPVVDGDVETGRKELVHIRYHIRLIWRSERLVMEEKTEKD